MGRAATAGVSVPAGATINSATLYYKSTSTSHDDPAINWHAQDSDNAAVFTTTDNDIVDRPRTSASVYDSATGIGTTSYRAVTITSLISAVTGRAGWVSGNNIALIADGQTGVDLWFAAYDTGSNIWYVEIDYTAVTPVTVTLNTLTGATSAVALTVVPGAVSQELDTLSAAVASVSLSVVPGARAVTLNTLSGAASAVGLAVAPGGVSQLMDTLTAGASAVHLAGVSGHVTIALSTLAAAFSAVDLAVTPGARAVALNTLAAALEAVDLTIGAGAIGVLLDTLTAALTAVPLPPTSGSFTLDIAAGGGDGYEIPAGQVTLDTENLFTSNSYPCIGLLFRGVAIPPGATVTSANLNIYPYTDDDPRLTIRGQFNPANFTTTNYNLSSRAKTSAGVSWIASNIGRDAVKSSPDISPVLNEIVGTEGWESGDDLALFLVSNGTGGILNFAAYDHATYPPPQLVVEWTLNPSADVTIPLDTLTGAATAVSLAVAPGAVSQLLDTLAVALAAQLLTVTPGSVGLLLDTLSAAAGHVALSVAPGAASVALNSLSATAAAVTLAPVPGGVAILLDTHSATLQAIAVSIQGDASYIALNTLTGALTVAPLAVLPGEAVASLNTLIGLLQVMDVSIGQGIVLSTLSAALSAVGAAVAPGEAVVTLASLVPALQAVGLSVAPGAVSVDLDTLNALLTLIAAIDTPDAVDVTIVLSSLMAALSVTDLGTIPGDMVIELQTMAAHMTLYDLIVFLMLGYAMHGTQAMSGARVIDYAPLLIKTGDTEGRER